MKATEIRELSISDLKERIGAERAKLAQMKINHAVSPIEDSSKIKKRRQLLARMITILHQMENNIEK
ncbi:MAG: 50S ribosomal protein L29 [Bacteroidales bacterium]